MFTTIGIAGAIITFLIWLAKRHFEKEDAETPAQKLEKAQLNLEEAYAKQDAAQISVSVNDALDAIERRLSKDKGSDRPEQHSISATGPDIQSR